VTCILTVSDSATPTFGFSRMAPTYSPEPRPWRDTLTVIESDSVVQLPLSGRAASQDSRVRAVQVRRPPPAFETVNPRSSRLPPKLSSWMDNRITAAGAACVVSLATFDCADQFWSESAALSAAK